VLLLLGMCGLEFGQCSRAVKEYAGHFELMKTGLMAFCDVHIVSFVVNLHYKR
jgi:hypothetical protein